MADHEVEVVVDVRTAPVVAVKHVGGIHVPPQLVQWPARSSECHHRPSDEHESVSLDREGPFEQVLAPAGERDCLIRTVATDPDLER